MPENIFERFFSLKGKAAVVTGASGGIGRWLAYGLAAAGADVVISGRSDKELRLTAELVELEAGRRCTVIQADLSDPHACRRLIDETVMHAKRLDVLVNCAGMNRRKPIEGVDQEDFDTIMNVNLKSVYFLSQAAHRVMKEQGQGGKIIHVGSLTSSMALGSTSVYGLTKAALTQLAKTQAVEWASDNIQVNCLAPGFVLTPLTEVPLWRDEKKKAWLLGRIPAKRPGKPEEMVAALLFMAGPGSSYLTGQTITIDGGVLAGGSWEE
jgi:2-deoxy-D-gluconate 3-dehydrogenase